MRIYVASSWRNEERQQYLQRIVARQLPGDLRYRREHGLVEVCTGQGELVALLTQDVWESIAP